MDVAKYEIRVNGRRVAAATSRRSATRKQAEFTTKGYRNVSVKRIGR